MVKGISILFLMVSFSFSAGLTPETEEKLRNYMEAVAPMIPVVEFAESEIPGFYAAYYRIGQHLGEHMYVNPDIDMIIHRRVGDNVGHVIKASAKKLVSSIDRANFQKKLNRKFVEEINSTPEWGAAMSAADLKTFNRGSKKMELFIFARTGCPMCSRLIDEYLPTKDITARILYSGEKTKRFFRDYRIDMTPTVVILDKDTGKATDIVIGDWGDMSRQLEIAIRYDAL